MQVLHRSSWLPLGRCGPPLFSSHLTFGQLTCWVAISEVQIILNVRPCVCDATKLNACVRELLGQFIHRDGDPEGLFNILLLPWTLNGVAHGCEVVFLVHWLICFFSFLVASFCIFDRHQWLCIICCSQPFSGPSILGWHSSTKPSWHTGVSQCIDIWLGLCSICAALHGAHWDVQTAWATQPAFTSSPSLFPKRGRKAMALTSKHRAHPFFFHFFLNCEIKLNGDVWKVCNRFSTPQAISC